jgi:hypothetical protein
MMSAQTSQLPREAGNRQDIHAPSVVRSPRFDHRVTEAAKSVTKCVDDSPRARLETDAGALVGCCPIEALGTSD